MTMRLTYQYQKDSLARELLKIVDPIAEAATDAVHEIGETVKQLARADIRAAGFSGRWANALRLNKYPRSGASVDAAAFVYHKIPYAGVFEDGATIQGKPLLWVPLSSAPKKIGRSRMTPENYRARVGPLVFVKPPGKPPLLMGQVASISRRSGSRTSLAALRRGAGRGGRGVTLVPIFVGVPAVTIGKKFHIAEIADAAQRRLPQLYSAKLRA